MPNITRVSRRLRHLACVQLVIVALLLGAAKPAPAAAADLPDPGGPVPFPTRSGDPKGSGAPLESQATGRLMVHYRAGASQLDRQRIRDAERLKLVAPVALADVELVEPAPGMSAGRAVRRLGARPDVAWVEPEYRRSTMAGPVSEPLFGQQWALRNTGQVVNGFAGVPDVDMNVPEAWGITTGSAQVVVAVIDDGVDFAHPDLAARTWVNPGEIAGNGLDDDANGYVDDVNGWDFCNNDNSVHDADDFHGTHVAGAIAASGNGVGIAGVAPGVTIMGLKFLSDDESCGTDAQAIAAIAYARENGAEIINASWGGPGDSLALRTAIEQAPGILFVAAAGNSNSDNDVNPVYPASWDSPNILSVASIHNEGFLADTTNYGLVTVDLSAPGEDIISALPDGDWGLLSGTSMAAANASGVAALAASAKPTLVGDGDALRLHLIATARALPSTLGWVGFPRLVDARAAVVARPDIRRLAGSDRYATAAAISAATFTPGVPYLFVATGANFPDALAGGALAAQVGSPLLLVQQSSIPTVILAEIQRLKPFHIYVLGGTSAISNAVHSQLAAYDHPQSSGPFRIAGIDRYATAAAISTTFDPGVPTAFVATGANFPDALSGVPATAALSGPLLLVKKDGIPQATATALNDLVPQQIVILGGTNVVSASVKSQLGAFTGGPVVRMAGADRYATAAAVAAQVFGASETAFVANGLGFPDALAGGPPAGAYLGPLLLVTRGTVPDGTQTQLQRLQPARIFVLGGTGVVGAEVVAQIDALFP